ncbi:hypothetical protein EJB05_16481, partial [Eragrostis curvula]
VHKSLEKFRNGRPANDPNRGSSPPAGEDPPLCECGEKCVSRVSFDYDTYGRRFWKCGEAERQKMWEEPKDEPVQRKLFKEPKCTVGCNFIRWIDDRMTPKDEKYVAMMTKLGNDPKGKGKGASGSK